MINVKTKVAMRLAGLLAACMAALIPATASGSVHTSAPTAALPFGLFESSNNDQYSFPVPPAYAIQYYGWQEGFQTAVTPMGASTEATHCYTGTPAREKNFFFDLIN